MHEVTGALCFCFHLWCGLLWISGGKIAGFIFLGRKVVRKGEMVFF